MARTPDRQRNAGKDTPATDEASAPGAVDAFLAKVRAAPVHSGGGRGRLIFALDATQSREPSWDIACDIQAEMFSATEAIGGLDVKLVFFRGFNECKAGSWQAGAAGLRKLMAKVRCRAGRTQVQRVLRHAIAEAEKTRIGALIYIGDAFEEDIDPVCHDAGRLALLGVPVFLFQEGQDPLARKAFQEIARLTNGAWCPFDPSSPGRLRDLLSAIAVYATGGIAALEDRGRRGDDAAAHLLADMRNRR